MDQERVGSKEGTAEREHPYSIISPIGGIIAAVCFFMPWVGCMGQNSSGADAGGVLWLVFLAALGIVGVFLHFKSSGTLSEAKLPVIGCAVVGIAIMLLKYVAFLNSEYSEFFKLRFGSIGTLLGFVAAMYGTSYFPRDR